MELLEFNFGALAISAGYIGLIALVFFDSGAFGFFLPGDSIVFTAGLLAAQGMFNIFFLCAGVAAAAMLGGTVGYIIGEQLGPRLFNREHSFWFNKKYIERTREYFEKYGAQTLLLARFTPVVRTFAPMFAGAGGMNRRKFMRWNIFGAVVWGAGAALLGYFVGTTVPDAQNYLLPIVTVVIIISFVPFFLSLSRQIKTSIL